MDLLLYERARLQVLLNNQIENQDSEQMQPVKEQIAVGLVIKKRRVIFFESFLIHHKKGKKCGIIHFVDLLLQFLRRQHHL